MLPEVALHAGGSAGLLYRRLNGEEKKALIEQGGNACGICRSSENLVVDHDHGTGLVRGVLCSRCNSKLGQFEALSVSWMKSDHARLGLEFVREYFDHKHRDLVDELEKVGREYQRVADSLSTIEKRKAAILAKLDKDIIQVP